MLPGLCQNKARAMATSSWTKFESGVQSTAKVSRWLRHSFEDRQGRGVQINWKVLPQGSLTCYQPKSCHDVFCLF